MKVVQKWAIRPKADNPSEKVNKCQQKTELIIVCWHLLTFVDMLYVLEDIILARNCSWPFDYNSRWSGTTTTRGPEATPSTCSTPSPTRDPVLPLLQRWFSNFLHFMADEKETNKEHLPKCMMYSVYCTYVLVSTTNIRIIQEKNKNKNTKITTKTFGQVYVLLPTDQRWLPTSNVR